MNHPSTVICQITKKIVKFSDALPVSVVRTSIFALIKKSYPEFSRDGFISKEALKKFRGAYIESVLVQEGRELSDLDKEVIQSLVDHENMVKNLNSEYDDTQTFGERISDKVAKFGGSWKFLITFAIVLIVWISINSYVLLARPFDPFPFILLNLILSCIAAVQAPVIMMSQNRKDAKDRLRAEHDYKVNLKAELEIRHLHEKIDHLLQHQWQRLLEIQELQLDMMEGLDVKMKQRPTNNHNHQNNHTNGNHLNANHKQGQGDQQNHQTAFATPQVESKKEKVIEKIVHKEAELEVKQDTVDMSDDEHK